jgi:hypothetical protein
MDLLVGIDNDPADLAGRSAEYFHLGPSGQTEQSLFG